MNNAFYDMNYSVSSLLTKNVIVNNCDIYTSQNSITAIQYYRLGLIGINIITNYTENIDVENNHIYNCQNPISINNSVPTYSGSGLPALYSGTMTISNNYIALVPPNSGINPSSAYFSDGIRIVGDGYRIPSNAGNINCKNNYLDNIIAGILFSGWWNKNFMCTNNEIHLQERTSISRYANFGIYLSANTSKSPSGNGNVVKNNLITADYWTLYRSPAITSGIQAYINNNTDIRCNTISGGLNGLLFEGTNTYSKIAGNKIGSTNTYGLTLNNFAVIGQQGSNENNLIPLPSDNHWIVENDQTGHPIDWGTTPTGTTNPTGHYATACFNNSNTKAYPLYVQNITGSDLDPSASHVIVTNILSDLSKEYDVNGNPQTIKYANVNSTKYCNYDWDQCNSQLNVNCPATYRTIHEHSVPADLGNAIELYEDIATGSAYNLEMPNHEKVLYVAQKELYNNLAENEEITQYSPILQSFVEQNQENPFDIMYQIDNLLTNGNTDAAQSLLNGFSPTNDVERNYVEYTSLIIKKANGQEFSTEDLNQLQSLASLCPVTEGAFILNARSLYDQLTETRNVYSEDCNSNQPQGRMFNNKKAKSKTKAVNEPFEINVYPNPVKNGEVQIKFKNSNGYNKMKITDMFGRLMKEERILPFINHLNLHLNYVPGVYTISISNELTGQKQIAKLIVQ